MQTTRVPANADDAVRLALDEALRDAGCAPLSYQFVEERLHAAAIDALWNDDMTLQEAARAAVRRNERQLIREGE